MGLRGFAAMDAARRRAIASMGGKAAHQQGVAHEFTSEEGRIHGRKGGRASADRRHPPARIVSSPAVKVTANA